MSVSHTATEKLCHTVTHLEWLQNHCWVGDSAMATNLYPVQNPLKDCSEPLTKLRCRSGASTSSGPESLLYTTIVGVTGL